MSESVRSGGPVEVIVARQQIVDTRGKVVGFELFSLLVMAFISWQLFSACQRPT